MPSPYDALDAGHLMYIDSVIGSRNTVLIHKSETKVFILLRILTAASSISTDLFLLPTNIVAAVVVVMGFIFLKRSCKIFIS